MDERAALVLLNSVRSLPTARLKKALAFFGCAVEVLKARPHDLVAAGGLTPLMAQQVERAKTRFNPAREMDQARQQGISVLILSDRAYPENLKEIFDPPQVLYVKGTLDQGDQNAVSVVGSRGASYYGLSCAQSFSYQLASWGLSVVSGMARGIDTAAHRGALEAGGRTIAVLGSGLDVIYPPENEELFAQIVGQGAVFSEFPLGTPPHAANFPMRNRIVSGLSKGVLVVEATQKSGALITARLAAEQGRDVFAIPGKVSSPTSLGTHELIKEGGHMVTEPEEILAALKPVLSCRLRPKGADAGVASGPLLSEEERCILGCLDDEPRPVDVIAEASGLSASQVQALLMRMELGGAVKVVPGRMYVKANSFKRSQ